MKLLLDCCCGPCASHCVETLLKDYEIILYSSNFNIHPFEEYTKRLQSLKKIAEINTVELLIENYDPEKWFQAIKGHENDKEGGERCHICFEFRLRLAAKTAITNNCEIFTTTLSISPHKNSAIINKIGLDIAKEFGLQFLAADFKKKDGYLKSVKLSEKYSLYRQKYCGCVYSIKK